MSGDAKQSRPVIAGNGSEFASGQVNCASRVRVAAAVAEGYPSVGVLVTRAHDGDKRAWDQLVERLAPLICSICHRYQLGRPAADDVGQVVWLRLVDQLDLVGDPAGLPGWVAATTRRECRRVLRAEGERHTALRVAFSQLPADCQQLLSLLIEHPRVPDAQLSARLGIPGGSIARRRCLERLRRHPAITALPAPPPPGA